MLEDAKRLEIAKSLDDLAAEDVWSADVWQRCYDLVSANVNHDELLGYVHDDLIHYTGKRLFRAVPIAKDFNPFRQEFRDVAAALRAGASLADYERNHEHSLPLSHEIELPRWVRIPAGLVVGLVAVLCAGASLSFLPLALHGPVPILGVAVVLVLVLGCLWVLGKCFRLLTGRKYKGGLMSPRALRVVSFCLLVLPIVGIFTGYYRERPVLGIFQAVMYFFGFLGLRAMAQRRGPATLTEKKDGQR